MSTDSFADLLQLTRPDPADDAFVGAPLPGDRVFGGHVTAQAVVATAATVPPGRAPHAVHVSYVRPGHVGVPVRLEVVRLRDGRSFSTRLVSALQDGAEILVALVAFQDLASIGDAEDWQAPGHVVDPALPDPDTAPAHVWLSSLPVLRPFDLRATRGSSDEGAAVFPLWIRTRDDLGSDPLAHAAAMASMCDVGIGGTAGGRRPAMPEVSTRASLDHTVWFHRHGRADDWLLMDVDPLSTTAWRTLVHGGLRQRDSRLVASLAQESIARPPS